MEPPPAGSYASRKSDSVLVSSKYRSTDGPGKWGASKLYSIYEIQGRSLRTVLVEAVEALNFANQILMTNVKEIFFYLLLAPPPKKQTPRTSHQYVNFEWSKRQL